MELTSSNMRAGTNSNWRGVRSAGGVSQLSPTNPLTLAACEDSADLFYSQLFPVRASGSDQTGVEGEAGGWAAHGADLKRVLREGIIVWTGL